MLSASAALLNADPMDYLWHSAKGEMAFWLNGDSGPIGWVRADHRGVQRFDKIHIPKGQRRYVYTDQFEVKYDQAFEEVVRACADLKREGKTFITEDMIQALIGLHKMGFAHSYESWQDGKLVGGGYGLQLGSVMSADSQFYRVSNASKACYGQMLLRLRDRGFTLVDVNVVAKHMVNYGEEWMPSWQFEKHLREHMHDTPSLTDDHPAPPLPWKIKYLLPAAQKLGALRRRILSRAGGNR
jgi:leucyl/phenylalanyl-tRNA--protein transferase